MDLTYNWSDSDTDVESIQWLHDLARIDIDNYDLDYGLPAVVSEPLYKSMRPPPLQFAPAQGGSTYPGDIPINISDKEGFCWMDQIGRLHLNMLYDNEEAYPHIYKQQALSVCMPSVLTPRIFAFLVMASRNKTPLFTVIHACNTDTREKNIIGEFLWCTHESVLVDKVHKAELVFVQVSTLNRLSVIEQNFNEEYLICTITDCCLGCSSGVGCFRAEKKSKRKYAQL